MDMHREEMLPKVQGHSLESHPEHYSRQCLMKNPRRFRRHEITAKESFGLNKESNSVVGKAMAKEG